MSEEYQVKDLSSLHIYRTEIPNIVTDMHLGVYVTSLYLLLKRIAGDHGECYMSNSKLAEKLCISRDKLIECKKELEKPHKMLDGLSLISIEKRSSLEKGDMPDLVNINNIWPINIAYIESLKKKLPCRPERHPPVANTDTPCRPERHKEEPIKKTSIKETTTPTPSNSGSQKPKPDSVVVVFDCLVGIGLSAEEMDCLSNEYRNDEASLIHGVKYATHKDTRIKTTLIQTIRWAAKQKPEIPKDQTEKTTTNKQIAEKYKSIAACPKGVTFEVLTNHAEIAMAGNYQPIIIEYSANGFEEQLKNALRKYDIRDKTKPINKEMKDKVDELF